MIPDEHDPGALFRDLEGPVLSCEVLPPAATDQADFLQQVRRLTDAGLQPVFLPDSPRGQPRACSFATAREMQVRGLRCVPHLNGRDRNRLAICGALEGAVLAGVRGIKAVTGDPVDQAAGQGVYELGSAGIVALVGEWNREAQATGGARVTPVVGHTLGEDAPESGHANLRRKVEAGARVVVTTPTLDPELLEAFVSRQECASLSLVAGIAYVPTARMLDYLLAEVPSFRVSDQAKQCMRDARSPAEAEQAGLDAVLRVVRAVKERVAGFQLVPLYGKVGSLGPLREAVSNELRT